MIEMLWSHRIEFQTPTGYKRIDDPRAPWVHHYDTARKRMEKDFAECILNCSEYHPTNMEIVQKDDVVRQQGRIWTSESGDAMIGDVNLTEYVNNIAEEYDGLDVEIILNAK